MYDNVALSMAKTFDVTDLSVLPPEIGRPFAPLLCFPLDDRRAERMRTEPCFGTCDNLKERLGLRVARQLGLALLLVDPQNGVVTVGINHLVV